jgi:hypothetical protein
LSIKIITAVVSLNKRAVQELGLPVVSPVTSADLFCVLELYQKAKRWHKKQWNSWPVIKKRFSHFLTQDFNQYRFVKW